jgi:hypothetical protein
LKINDFEEFLVYTQYVFLILLLPCWCSLEEKLIGN